MTLYSLRYHNPNWQIHLYSILPENCSSKQWSSSEDDDNSYHGFDYSSQVKHLGIEEHLWTPPFKPLACAHACDLFQWWILGTVGGFYADMDILWLRPLNQLHASLHDYHAAFCLEGEYMAIGLFASAPECQLFCEMYHKGCALPIGDTYQYYGTELVYRVSGGRKSTNFGPLAVRELRKKFSQVRITVLPDVTVYPYNWQYIHRIFLESNPLPPTCYGVHWFGGSKLSQKWNNLLTPSNWQSYDNTFTRHLREILL